MASGKLAQKMAGIARSWLHDPIRPHLQLSAFLESLASHPNLTPQAVRAAQLLQNSEVYKKVGLLPRMFSSPSLGLSFLFLVSFVR